MEFFLNNARNCLRLFLRNANASSVFVPFELCTIVANSIRLENLQVKFYHIDNNFTPILNTKSLSSNDFLLYPNYFGVCEKQATTLAENFPNFIYDATQSFFSQPKGIATIYSLRKFFPIPDGGILCTNLPIKNIDALKPETFNPQLNSYDVWNFNYTEFLKNELKFNRTNEIKTISPQSLELFKSINSLNERDLREKNYKILHNFFKAKNKIPLPETTHAMVYPLLCPENENIAKKLQNEGVFLQKYNYLPHILPLPLTCDAKKLLEKLI